MEKLTKKILARMTDCVSLSPTLTRDELLNFVDAAAARNFHSIATPYCYHKIVFEELRRLGKDKTTIVLGGAGFPDGNWDTALKAASIKRCLNEGCGEIDLTANLGWIKSQMWNEVLDEIKMSRDLIGETPLKVICHVPLLTDDEIKRMCELLADSGIVDYLKTATGREGGPTTLEQAALILKELKGTGVKLKVSGGVRQLEKVVTLYEMGVDRLGMSQKSGCEIYDALPEA